MRSAKILLPLMLFLAAPLEAQRRESKPPRVLGVVVQDTAAPGQASAVAAADRLLGRPVLLPGARQPDASFIDRQLEFPRVARARVDAKFTLKSLFRQREMEYPPYEIFLRVFKHEQVVELWARPDSGSPFRLLKEYPICAVPGRLGPKQRAGDYQVPEGFYHIEAFNPQSEFYLSLRVNYPNGADRIRGDTAALGGDIFIHGGCKTVGCVPVQDDNMKEIYWLAVEARAAGQTTIPVHIFPTRMTTERLLWLTRVFSPDHRLREFWRDLQEGYDHFEQTHLLPDMAVTVQGGYAIANEQLLAPPDPHFAARLPPPGGMRLIGPRPAM